MSAIVSPYSFTQYSVFLTKHPSVASYKLNVHHTPLTRISQTHQLPIRTSTSQHYIKHTHTPKSERMHSSNCYHIRPIMKLSMRHLLYKQPDTSVNVSGSKTMDNKEQQRGPFKLLRIPELINFKKELESRTVMSSRGTSDMHAMFANVFNRNMRKATKIEMRKGGKHHAINKLNDNRVDHFFDEARLTPWKDIIA